MLQILNEIIENKKLEIASAKRRVPLEKLKKDLDGKLNSSRPHSLKAVIEKRNDSLHVIAEIKRQSPSAGILRKDFHPLELAQRLEASGACALSVLTDEKFFGGSLDILRQVRQASRLPLLRKDFMMDPYQVWEARLAGADAILLIAGILSDEELGVLSHLGQEATLEILYEVHSEEDLERILPLKPQIIGINNRDLRTFKVDLATTAHLLKRVPKHSLVVAESGLRTHEDLMYLKSLGVHAFLIGEALMLKPDPGEALANLIRYSHGTS